MKAQTVTKYIRISFVIAILLATSALLPRVAARVLPRSDADVREIRVDVRDMSYFVDGIQDRNPTLHVGAGQRVRIVLTNEDAGMSHDFRIPALTIGSRLLKGKGSDAIVFTAPATPGKYAYKCTPHSEMMQGTIEVE